MRAELANLNHCAVLFLSRAAVNFSWYDSTPYVTCYTSTYIYLYTIPYVTPYITHYTIPSWSGCHLQ